MPAPFLLFGMRVATYTPLPAAYGVSLFWKQPLQLKHHQWTVLSRGAVGKVRAAVPVVCGCAPAAAAAAAELWRCLRRLNS